MACILACQLWILLGKDAPTVSDLEKVDLSAVSCAMVKLSNGIDIGGALLTAAECKQVLLMWRNMEASLQEARQALREQGAVDAITIPTPPTPAQAQRGDLRLRTIIPLMCHGCGHKWIAPTRGSCPRCHCEHTEQQGEQRMETAPRV